MKTEVINEMSLKECLSFQINDKPCTFDDGRVEPRKWFSNKDAAYNYSNHLEYLHNDGLGLVYGPFVNSKSEKWWEVSYKETA